MKYNFAKKESRQNRGQRKRSRQTIYCRSDEKDRTGRGNLVQEEPNGRTGDTLHRTPQDTYTRAARKRGWQM